MQGIRNSKSRVKELVRNGTGYQMMLDSTQEGNSFKGVPIELPNWLVAADEQAFEAYPHKEKAFKVLCEVFYRGVKVFLRQLIDVQDTPSILMEYFEGKRVVSARTSVLAVAKATMLDLLVKNYDTLQTAGKYNQLLMAVTGAKTAKDYINLYRATKDLLAKAS